ncbi:response regulator in two-component regulatory system with PhoR (or CreC), regulation of Pi uptake (OmpR family) [Candidatus Competibacter denitrificans Run_A_D11]|jgi:two-component system phosphate regulon response regulator PhoB|uniref:Phosphate regulon transcriptional regulatory protein PhoB n=1 Tax=Candidatus Competibacter denitrificans Run_A_D11 TaxID=1400863 RepID=W6M6U2_9GAMM|nr:phosphate regulon transcriptional regulator PhoB [Candidatus Competibacter denitrificans]CDI03611.1 response regulator in two-component regulatory system with PhoR (or CreC), regulation of Pi uptake (OmpR family) [Candidatus Competibacter denitrificans Run_A_D11]HAS85351.1 phosphate regulon transcriptional regulatory protein PhoB [Candidatus Competibacteraceae bacterium]HRC69239.1 phosphate regulon transcriptional regulator PhoB [Candidatus Competibacter denitrificans]
MNAKSILIVEDEQPIREMVVFSLAGAGFEVREAADARQAQSCIAERLPDLVLLDWMLPGISGIDFARRLKREDLTRELPIIMLTARAEEEDKVQGLESGSDDYITKPFSPRELVARIRAVLRRGGPAADDDILRANGLTLDVASHRISAGETLLDVGPTEYRLLEFFMAHPERVYSRGQLLDRVWGSNVYVEERTVDVHIRRLRKVLEPHGYDALIQTVRGAGYRFSTRL